MLSVPLPFNKEVEAAVLSTIVNYKNKKDYIFKLNESDFFLETNKELYKTIFHMVNSGQSIDIITLSNMLSKKLSNSIVLVSELFGFVVTSENIDHHIRILKTYSIKREAIIKAQQVIEAMTEGIYDNPVDVKNDVLAKMELSSFDNRRLEDYEIGKIVVNVFNSLEFTANNQNEEVLYTSFYDLDKITAGLHKGEMTIIAARPGVGKTAFVGQLILNLAKKGNSCVLFSLEMTKEQLAKRLLSNEADINSQRIRYAKTLNDNEWDKITSAMGIIGNLPIFINDTATTVQEIRGFCRDLRNKNRLDVIAVDYLQLCKSLAKAPTREREVAELSWSLKQLSKEFNVPVIVLSQFSREAEKQGREPVLSDLRDSGAIEQDADNIIFLHVPKEVEPEQDNFDIKVIIAKQRNGPTGAIYLNYDKRTFKFLNIKN